MAWDHVTSSDVLRAIKEYDRLGPERFFSEHGFAPTTTYELAWEGRRYPPKAILGTGEMEFCTDPHSTQTHNVVATMPGDKDYSPPWLRVVYDSAACASVHNLETAIQAKKVAANVLLINCPMVSVKHGS